jgi:hypothetical protein
VLPAADGREQGDVVIGTISVDSFVAHALLTLELAIHLFQRILCRGLVFRCRGWVTQIWLVLLIAPLVVVQFVRVFHHSC